MNRNSYHLVARRLAAVAGLWMLALGAVAADPVIRTSLRPDTGITDTEVLQFTIVVENAQRDVQAGRLTDLRNLGVLNGPSTGQSTQMQVGPSGTVSSTTFTFTWTLRALGPGPAEIPPVEVQVAGTTFRTDAVRFQVTAGSSAQPPAVAPGPSRQDPEPRVFLKAELSEREVYVGEPVLLTMTLLARPQIQNLQWVERPEFSRFWVEQVPADPDRERYVTDVAGERYYAYPLERRMLVPTSQGSFTVDPYALQLQVVTRSRDLFESIFSRSQGRNIIRKSEPLQLTVLPLPSQGRPPSYHGAVGEFLMSAELDRTEAAVNDAVALRVTVEGEGFLKPVQPPILDPPPGIRIQEPNSEESITIRSGVMISRKTWEWLMLPASPGQVAIPQVRFGWFDPKSGRYREQVEDGLVLTVVPGDGESGGTLPGGRLVQQGRDIQYIKLAQDDLELGSRPVHREGWFQLLVVAPVLLFPVGILAGRWYALRTGDVRKVRSRKARARARKKLVSAGKLVDGKAGAEFHEAVARTLVDYVADRFDRSSSGLTYDDVEHLLVSRAVQAGLVRRFRDCLESCDFARYVPAAGQSGRRSETLKEVRDVLDQLEKVL